MIILGVDPGTTGCLAAIHPGRTRVEIYPFKSLTETDILKTVLTVHVEGACHAYLELVGAMPRDGRSSLAKFMRGYGFLRGVLKTLRIPFDDIPPQKWQKAFSLGAKFASTNERKNAHKAKAQQLFPSLSGLTLATSDAVLLAEYGYRQQR